ncbi:MAG TPA: hypothetical protein DCL41_05965 [Bdellovibrionales bacterium]|nr:hypothetical protein [Pseudobdellovibrionaceae bacterium]HAG91396.1 hypothetical protein [Bdellovibrionales bacterium]|tara:strand:+ start:718 stop:1074 length:357 start_codon:yes stop_codon:yes gene_type:complete
MFNLGFSELILLAVVALVFIGPKQLPEVARMIGRLINEWKRATSDFSMSIKDNEAFRDWERRKNEYLNDLNDQVHTTPDQMKSQEPMVEEMPPVQQSSPGKDAQLSLNLDGDSEGSDK